MVPMVPFRCSENLLLAQKQRSGAPWENILIANPYINQIVESTIKLGLEVLRILQLFLV
jgi:hypothetical protein